MRNIILDSGAFIAAEKRDKKLTGLLLAAERAGSSVIVPATVVAEIWRNPPRPNSVKLLGSVDFVSPLDESRAKAVGNLIGASGITQVIDANVAALAVLHAPALVLTADPKDIAALVKASGITCALASASKAMSAAVAIEPI